jgi:hypothetical protein
MHSVHGIERRYCFRSWSVQKSLIEAIEGAHADYIVPTDDRAIWQLHALAVNHPQYKELVVRSLGDSNSFETVRSRIRLFNLAESLQIRTPRTVPLRNMKEAICYANSWGYPALVKRDGTTGGRGVAVVRTPKELLDAFLRLRRSPSALASLKRRLVDGDCLAFLRPSSLPPQDISLQSFIAGKPANAMYSCFKGELLATLQVQTVCAQHATGAALIVERINDPRIEDAGRKLAQALNLSGFFGLDFLLENGSGYPYLIEMNPRATQLGHLPLENPRDGSSLAEALWLAWTGNKATQAGKYSSQLPQQIAFYPQALVLGTSNSLLASAWLDCPDEEPDLVRELSRTGWPERRLLYRLFHQFYSVPPDEPVFFSDANSDANVLEIH